MLARVDDSAARGRRRRIGRWAIELGLVAVVFFAVQWWLARDVVRGPLPPLAAPMINAPSFEQWRATRGADGFVLYVWASWCAICKAVEHNIEAVARDTPVLTMAMSSGDAAAVSRFLQSRDLRWPTLVDGDGRSSRRLGVDAVPTLLLVDRRGQVRLVTQGYTTELGIRLRWWWVRRLR